MEGVYRAPDGSEFSDLKAYRRHIFVNYFCFKDLEGQVLVKNPGEVGGQEFHLENLKNCTVMVLDNTERVVASNLENCKVFLGPCAGTVAIRKSSNCFFTIATKELRIADSNNCTLRTFTPSHVQLDNCHDIHVGRFNGAYSGLTEHFRMVGLEPSTSSINVTDFSKNDADLPKPHFTLMSQTDEEADVWAVELENASGPPENPVFPTSNETSMPPAPLNPPPPLDGSAASVSPDAAQHEGVDDMFGEQVGISEDDPSLFNEPTETENGEMLFDNSATSHDAFGDELNGTTTEVDAFGAEEDHFGGESSADAFDEPSESQPPLPPQETDDSVDFFSSSSTSAPVQSEEPFGDAFGSSPLPTAAHPPAYEMEGEKDPFTSSGSAAVSSDEGDAIQKWEIMFKERIDKLTEEHANVKASLLEKAEEDLDEHYEERTKRNAVRFNANREAEKALLEQQEPSAAMSPWERVVSLIETKAPKEAEERSRARMRGLLIQMKNS